MRESTLVLLLVIAAGCDRTETDPAAAAEVAAAPESSAPAPEAPKPEPATDEAKARDEAKASDDVKAPATDDAKAADGAKAPAPPPDPGPVVLKMADGSGEPVRLGTLRDFHGLPVRLPGHTLAERSSSFQLRDGKSAVLELDVPPSKPSHVTAFFLAPSIATAEGVTLGQRFSDVKDRLPDLACQGTGGQDGTLVECEGGEGVTALFQISKEYVELPDPMTLAQAEAEVGKKVVTELWWESEAVPEPVSTTEPAARARHGVLPAGVYWVDDGYSACDLELAPTLCIAPGAAVVAGTFADAKAAARALDGLDPKALEPGYPLVVHTDQIHRQTEGTRGIAIVVALLAGEAEAKDWAAEHAALGKLEVVALMGPRAIAGERKDEGAKPQAVVALRPGAKRGKGECALEGGTFAVIAADEIGEDMYARVPARCEDGTATTIAWRDTRVEAVFVRTDKGPRLVQLVGAQCDQPIWRAWPLAAGGLAKGRGTPLGPRPGSQEC